MLITAFDIEYDFSAKKITSCGHWSSNGTGGDIDVKTLMEILNESDVIIGHNILQHDLQVLEKHFGYTPESPHTLDTLYVSSILFAEKPYHKLTKDYLTRESVSTQPNPTLDSKKTYDELLPELIQRWNDTPKELQQLLYHLLHDQRGFSGFFEIIQYTSKSNLEDAVLQATKGVTCATVDLVKMAKAEPLEFAASMAIIKAREQDSILPVWLTHAHEGIRPLIAKLRSTDCGSADCTYCQTNLSAIAGLRKFFGFKGFRAFSENENPPLQQQIVEAGLAGRSFLAVLPTGGGKSLCYQIPALMAHEQRNALTIVISPLQSLMKDQVDNLHRKDITSAWTINGLVDSITRSKAFNATEDGSASMLYLSPESLRSSSIFKLLVKRDIARFVIDEAHCFSNWGHDFRTDYMYIANFINKIEDHQPGNTGIPISCFTATAKPGVIRDISQYFKERKQLDLEVYTTSAGRTNLSYAVTHAESEEKFERLLNLLDQCKGPVIIYVSRVKSAEGLAEDLKRVGRTALVYHGRLLAEEKEERQDLFMNDDSGFNIMVATSAFGMGVDKDNVTDVIHYEISSSLENYIQEAGRAGRDPKINANCHILYNEDDLQKHFALLNSSKLNKKDIEQIWRALTYYKRERFSKSALEIAEQAGWDIGIRDLQTRVKTALTALEEEGFIEREENATRVFAQSILVENFGIAREVITNRVTDELELQEAIRIMQFLVSREETHIDTIATYLHIDREKVGQWVNRFKEWKLLGDSRELSGMINLSTGSKGARKKTDMASEIENKLIEYFEREGREKLQIHKKQLHLDLLGDRADARTFHVLERLLRTWQMTKQIKARVLYEHGQTLEIRFVPDVDSALDRIKKRQKHASELVDLILEKYITFEESKDKYADFRFILSELHSELNKGGNLPVSINDIEEALFYLIRLGIVEIDGGLMVLYHPMKITRVADSRQRYLKENHQRLEDFYRHRTEQIHIVGEYAKKMLRSHLEALQFVDDYFNSDYEQFIRKYFQGEKGRIGRPITRAKFKELFGVLSEEQTAVIKDGKSKNILVSAGPGSGKTRVLVYKVASILMMEDVKPEQFLMLTFSRQAAEEMRLRSKGLIGPVANYIDIKTFHSYAFQLIGLRGDLEHSENVLERATEAIEQEPGLFPMVSAKDLIVVDEYQDIDSIQFKFLTAIINLAGDARVVVVGDDDQNIYEFRGSSTKFMRDFQELPDCKSYFLRTNYRSKFNLVEFTNRIANKIPGDRLKKDYELLAHDQRLGELIIHQYPPKSILVEAVADEILKDKRVTSTAVLTMTNEEALQINDALHRRSIPTNLILDRKGYHPRNILEFRYFTYILEKGAEHGTGLVLQQTWISCIDDLKYRFAHSAILPEVESVINRFAAAHSTLYLVDWKEFLRGLRHEDIHVDDNERVWVSTMHKAKGREFDGVFLHIPEFVPDTQEEHRLLYVAVTRAKSKLHIHTNKEFLNREALQLGKVMRSDAPKIARQPIHLIFGLGHVHLGNVQKKAFQKAMQKLITGTQVEIDPERIFPGTRHQCKFSKFAVGELKRWIDKGYALGEASVDRIVLWHDKDKESSPEYRVPILRIALEKPADSQ